MECMFLHLACITIEATFQFKKVCKGKFGIFVIPMQDLYVNFEASICSLLEKLEKTSLSPSSLPKQGFFHTPGQNQTCQATKHIFYIYYVLLLSIFVTNYRVGGSWIVCHNENFESLKSCLILYSTIRLKLKMGLNLI